MSLTVTDILKFRESESDPWQRLLLQANINFNLIYPVGSIYMSTVNVNPATLFGGTWEQLEDRFLLGAGTTYTAGDTGGEAEHTLTEREMPSHNHISLNNGAYNVSGASSVGAGLVLGAATYHSTSLIGSAGGDQPHNNMPPYIVVYMWKRLTLSPSLTPLPMNVLGDVASEDIVPISKGGTGADNAADARANLGVGSRTLLWTNSTPNTLAAGTVNIDMSGYDDVEIECTRTGSTDQVYFTKSAIGTSSVAVVVDLTTIRLETGNSNLNAITLMTRTADVYSSGIVFSSGQMIYNGALYTNWDSRAVPYRVWGVKY